MIYNLPRAKKPEGLRLMNEHIDITNTTVCSTSTTTARPARTRSSAAVSKNSPEGGVQRERAAAPALWEK